MSWNEEHIFSFKLSSMEDFSKNASQAHFMLAAFAGYGDTVSKHQNHSKMSIQDSQQLCVV